MNKEGQQNLYHHTWALDAGLWLHCWYKRTQNWSTIWGCNKPLTKSIKCQCLSIQIRFLAWNPQKRWGMGWKPAYLLTATKKLNIFNRDYRGLRARIFPDYYFTLVRHMPLQLTTTGTFSYNCEIRAADSRRSGRWSRSGCSSASCGCGSCSGASNGCWSGAAEAGRCC